MNKLKLDVESLKVDSFSPESVVEAPRGTVEANAIVRPDPTGEYSLCWICPNSHDTCEITENVTCMRTRQQTCLCTQTWQPVTV